MPSSEIKFDNYFNKFETEFPPVSGGYPEISENSQRLLTERYYMKMSDDDGNIIFKEKTFGEFCLRISRCLASAETMYTDDLERIKLIERNIYNDLMLKRFLFNSPALFNLGRGICNDSRKMDLHNLVYKSVDDVTLEDYKLIFKQKNIRQMCFACFVVGVEDNLQSIMGSMTDAALISKAGGGVGFNFGKTRERGSSVHGGMGGKASGPVSWIRMFNGMADAVVQGGQRRAALMGMLNDNHPDIYEFIHAKDDDGDLSKFNLSVAISDELMFNVINKIDKPLKFVSRQTGNTVNEIFTNFDEHNNPVYKENVTCDELWNDICEHAWKRGDPGVMFIDRANNDNILKLNEDWYFNSTNPCGEQVLPDYTACNLGSINMNAFLNEVEDKDGNTVIAFNVVGLVNQVFRSVYYLDLILDASEFPVDKIKERSLKIRPIGLGVMGLADIAFRCGQSYKSPEFVEMCNVIATVMAVSALDATSKLVTNVGKDKFPEHELVSNLFEKYGITEEFINENSLEVIMNNIGTSGIPFTLFNTVNHISALKSIFEEFKNDDEKYIMYAKNLLKDIIKGNLRNSRRLTVAPTGSTSMIFDASGGIEPLFSFSWGRKVFNASTMEKKTTTYDYVYPYLDEDERKSVDNDEALIGDKYLCANDLSTNEHIAIVSVFSKFVDSSISKTINLPRDATVDDVKLAYITAYKCGCKGITVYRDGSRDEQPITKKSVELPVIKAKKERPKFSVGITENVATSQLGKLYVTLNFDETMKPFEIWIRIGKSGNELTSMVDALARTLSIALRSGTQIEDLINTLIGMNSSTPWIYDSDVNGEIMMTSIPDAVAKLLIEILQHKSKLNSPMVESDEMMSNSKFSAYSNENFACPSCGSTSYHIDSGCKVCLKCGYSKCGV